MMLLDLVCADCLLEQVDKKKVTDTPEHYLPIPFEAVNDSGLYNFSCTNGHKSKTFLINIEFEILFDYSINAIADGYFREAVSSFTSSMERYFEFFIKVILRSAGTEFENIDKIWKQISKQSERQLGAYITLYAQTFNDIPELLNTNKDVPFRNRVIHQGYIPSRQEAIEYGDRILEIIESSFIPLKNKFPKVLEETFKHYSYQARAQKIIKKEEEKLGKELNVGGVNILTTISVIAGRERNPDDDRNGNIESQVKRVIEHRSPRRISLYKKVPNTEEE